MSDGGAADEVVAEKARVDALRAKKVAERQKGQTRVFSVWVKLSDYSSVKELVRAKTSQAALIKLLRTNPDCSGSYGTAEVRSVSIIECNQQKVW